jgi:23S rRNA pseudouridine2605 synthase
VETPATLVASGDVVRVDGKPLPERMPPRMWRYHKPVGLVTTHKDPEGRPTVFDNLPADLPRVISVGRLDLNSEGLLLLTNDGDLARRLELPANAWSRRYRVRVYGEPTPEMLDRLASGMVVDGVRYGKATATLERQQGSNAWLEVALTEGKNREIRKLMEAIGLSVNRLIRINYGPFALGDLPPGAAAEVPPKVLRDTLGNAVRGRLPSGAEEGRQRRRRERGEEPAAPAKAAKPVEAGSAARPPRPPRPHRFGDESKRGRKSR